MYRTRDTRAVLELEANARYGVAGGWLKKAIPALLLVAANRFNGPKREVESNSGVSYEVRQCMFDESNIPHVRDAVARGKCTPNAATVPWLVLELIRQTYNMITMEVSDAMERWWDPMLRPSCGSRAHAQECGLDVRSGELI